MKLYALVAAKAGREIERKFPLKQEIISLAFQIIIGKGDSSKSKCDGFPGIF